MRDFLINVGAGVFLSIVTWLLFRVLAPFYLAWRYQAPRIEGDWSFHDSEAADAPAVGTATIRQSGERITASATRTTSRKGKPVSRTFQYTGRVRDGRALLSFEQPDSGGFIAGHMVLKVSDNLKILSGYTVYLDREVGKVVAYPLVYRRL